MINRISLDACYKAASAVFAEAERDGRQMAIAVSDEAGGVVFAVRSEKCASRVLTHAIRKSYTSAIMQRDTITFRDQDREQQKTLADWGSDPQLTHLVGGVALKAAGASWGGVGVGGNTTERDDEIGHLAARILLRSLPSSSPATPTAGRGAQFGAADDAFALTGVLGLDPDTGQLGESPQEQFEFAFESLRRYSDQFGFSLGEIGRITVITPDATYRPLINPPWLDLFPGEDRPARRTTHAPLPPRTYVELEVVGARGERTPIEIEGVRHRDPLPMAARVGRHLYSSAIGSDIPHESGRRPEREAAIVQAFENLQAVVQAAGATMDNVADVWTYLGMWDLHPEYVDIWVDVFKDDASRPSRKTFYYPRVDIQLQFDALLGAERTNLEIAGIGHHDPIPMGASTGNLVTTSGVDGRDPATGKAPRGVVAQSAMALSNLIGLFKDAGVSRKGIYHVTGLVGHSAYVGPFVAEFERSFPVRAERPALQLLELGLPARDMLVQFLARGMRDS
ncbi:MAG: heme-binding protein [Acidimicrobiaceae bacterium]|nr:heme-binding protein [Acidimicrobiaceae bacterium]